MSTQSPGPSARPERPASSGTGKVWTVVGVLLAVGVVVPLLVGTYDSEPPSSPASRSSTGSSSC